MEFDKFAESYDTGLMGKGSKRFYVDLVKTLDIRDGDAVRLGNPDPAVEVFSVEQYFFPSAAGEDGDKGDGEKDSFHDKGFYSG